MSDVCPAYQASPGECWCDLEPAGVVLDGLGARCADRPGLAAFSCVLGDDASAAPASSPASRGALEQLQRKPHRAGIGGGSRRWFRTGHGREQYHDSMNHDTVIVRCDRMGILSTGYDQGTWPDRTPPAVGLPRWPAGVLSCVIAGWRILERGVAGGWCLSRLGVRLLLSACPLIRRIERYLSSRTPVRGLGSALRRWSLSYGLAGWRHGLMPPGLDV